MASVGEQLRAARAKKGVSASKAASVTRIKVQFIEAMEVDDFKGMAAPAYARGFIRLYANYLKLDPAPLVDEYMLKHVGEGRTPLVAVKKRSSMAATGITFVRKLITRLRSIPRERVIPVLSGCIVVFLLFTLVFATSHCVREIEQKDAMVSAGTTEVRLDIMREPPPPYIDETEME